MWGLGLDLPGLGLGFYEKVSVSSRNLSQVSVSEVTVSTTSLTVTFERACCTVNAVVESSMVINKCAKEVPFTTLTVEAMVHACENEKEIDTTHENNHVSLSGSTEWMVMPVTLAKWSSNRNHQYHDQRLFYSVYSKITQIHIYEIGRLSQS